MCTNSNKYVNATIQLHHNKLHQNPIKHDNIQRKIEQLERSKCESKLKTKILKKNCNKIKHQ